MYVCVRDYVKSRGPVQSPESIGLLTDLLIKLDGLFSLQTHNQEIESYMYSPVIYDKLYSVCLLVKFRKSSVGREIRNGSVCTCTKRRRVMPLLDWPTMQMLIK